MIPEFSEIQRMFYPALLWVLVPAILVFVAVRLLGTGKKPLGALLLALTAGYVWLLWNDMLRL